MPFDGHPHFKLCAGLSTAAGFFPRSNFFSVLLSTRTDSPSIHPSIEGVGVSTLQKFGHLWENPVKVSWCRFSAGAGHAHRRCRFQPPTAQACYRG
jgi:hypothetical protein